MKYFILTGALLLCALPAFAQPQSGEKQAVPVFTGTVTRKPVADRVEALGTLRANETVTLTANVTDIVTSIRFDDGQRVTAGDVLVEMSNAEESAALKEAQANVNEALRQVNRLKPLVKQGAASKSALDTQSRNYQTAKAQLEATKSRLKDRLITAPFDGLVGLRNISVGTLLQPGTTITTLDDDSIMKLDFTVPSVFLSMLKIGTPIEARTNAYPEKIFKGEITSIGSQIDPVSRSITARALIPNEEKILKPGLLMTVTLKKNERMALAVPEIALIVEGAKHFIYLIDDNNTARKQAVTIGMREPGYVEITEGLKEGETFVSDGVLKLTDGAPVFVKAEKKTGEESLQELLNQSAPASGETPEKQEKAE